MSGRWAKSRRKWARAGRRLLLGPCGKEWGWGGPLHESVLRERVRGPSRGMPGWARPGFGCWTGPQREGAAGPAGLGYCWVGLGFSFSFFFFYF